MQNVSNAITITVNPLLGDAVTIHLLPLTTRAYFEVMHDAIVSATSGLTISGKSVKFDLKSVLASLDFDKFAKIAGALLDGAVVEGHGAITSTMDCEFFRARIDALYMAVFEALKAQCPDLFLALKAKAAEMEKAKAAAVQSDSDRPVPQEESE